MGCLCTCFMLMLILIQKRNINVIVIVIFSLYVFFVFFFSAFIHFLISSTRRFFVFRSSSFQKNETNSCQFQFIRVINTPSITSTSQRHLYFLQSRIPLFYESTKKKINKKNKNHRHLVSKTSFNLLVIHVEILRSTTTCAENDYHFTPENTFTLRLTLTARFTRRSLQHPNKPIKPN